MIAVIGALLPVLAWTKSPIRRIEVQAGSGPARVIEGRALAGKISIWNGPGTSSGHTSAHSLADWTLGIVEPPAGLSLARVTIFCAGKAALLSPCHQIGYAYDAQHGRGYIYLPGPAEEGYRLNVRHVLRGIEGHWFGSTPEWDVMLSNRR